MISLLQINLLSAATLTMASGFSFRSKVVPGAVLVNSVLVTAHLRFASFYLSFSPLCVGLPYKCKCLRLFIGTFGARLCFHAAFWNNQLTDIKTSVALGVVKRPLMSHIMTKQQTTSCSNQHPSGGERDAPDGGGGLIEPNRLDCESLACAHITMER